MSDEKPPLALAPVVDLPCVTRFDIEANKVLSAALDKLTHAVVIGWEVDGDTTRFYFASNKSDGGEVLWLLKLAEVRLMKAGGA